MGKVLVTQIDVAGVVDERVDEIKGAPSGIAPLTAGQKLPEANVPDRLSASNIADQIDAVGGAEAQATGMLNPEDPRNDAILQVVGGVVPPGQYFEFITDDLNAARPTPPTIAEGQKVRWCYISATETPVPANMLDGDRAEWIEEVPLPWSLTDLPNLVGWWDATKLVGSVADGAAVSTWNNEVAGQPDATIFSGGTPPVFDVDGLSGHPAVVFTDGGPLIASGFANLPLPYTVYLFGEITAAASDRVFDARNSADGNLFQMRNGSGNWVLYKGGTAVVTGPAVTGTRHLYVSKWAPADGSNPTAVSLEIDDSGTPATGTGTGNLALAKISIGGQAAGLTTAITGKIQLFLLVNGVVSAGDHEHILDYIDSINGTTLGA